MIVNNNQNSTDLTKPIPLISGREAFPIPWCCESLERLVDRKWVGSSSTSMGVDGLVSGDPTLNVEGFGARVVGRSASSYVSPERRGTLASASDRKGTSRWFELKRRVITKPSGWLFFRGGKGIGFTKKKPKIMGKDVPIARTNRKDDVSPGNATWAKVENTNAESPNPERTRLVETVRCQGMDLNQEGDRCTGNSDKRTAWSGKLFAVALIALAIPALAPIPVSKPHNRSTRKLKNDNDEIPSGNPEI